MAEPRAAVLLAAQWALGRPGWYALPASIPWLRLGETIYRDPARPAAMTRAASASVHMLWRAAEEEAAARRANACAILEGIGSGRRVTPVQPHPRAMPAFLRLPVHLEQGVAGFDAPVLAARLGVAPSYPSTLAVVPAVRPWIDDTTTRWPGGEHLARTLFTVPTHSLLTGPERQELIRLLWAYGR